MLWVALAVNAESSARISHKFYVFLMKYASLPSYLAQVLPSSLSGAQRLG
jgi:hypothetical protein